MYLNLPNNKDLKNIINCIFILKMTKSKRLYRSKKEQMISGVCGGIGEYFKVDPTIIRLGTVLVTVLSVGIGIIIYLAAWVIVPEKRNNSKS